MTRALLLVLWALGAAGCPTTRPPADECVTFLRCFFPRDTTFPEGEEIDGGVDVDGTPLIFTFDSFRDPTVQQLVREAYAENGTCWRVGNADDEKIGDACQSACALALADECARAANGQQFCPDILDGAGVAFAAGGGAPELTCASLQP
jgi:hypothetical protein